MSARPASTFAGRAVDAALRAGRGNKLAQKARPGPIGRAADAVVRAISPRRGLMRQHARLQTAILAGGYDVVNDLRTHRRGPGRGGTANEQADPRTLWELRELSREHDRNTPLYHGIVERAIDNVLGDGLGWRANTGDEGLDREVNALVTDRMQGLFLGGIDFQEGLRLALRAVWVDGDVLLAFTDDGRVQAYEGEWLVTPRDIDAARRERISHGVETNARGDVIAYHVAKAKRHNRLGWTGRANAERIDAADAILPANRTRFGQSRGLPMLTSTMGLIDKLDAYIDAETLAAQMQADWAWFLKRDPSLTDALPGTEVQTDPNATPDSDTTFTKLLRHEPGMVYDGVPGEELDFVAPTRPTHQFEPYLVTCARIVGAAGSMPLELVLLDFSKTNYSSARAALLEAHRAFRREQRFTISRIAVPIVRRLIVRAVAARELPPAENIYRAAWQPGRWWSVDPYKQAKADETDLKNGVKTESECIREHGRDPEEVWDERKWELNEQRQRGLIPRESQGAETPTPGDTTPGR